MNVVYNVTLHALGSTKNVQLKIRTKIQCYGIVRGLVPCVCAVAGRRNRQRTEAKLGAAAVHTSAKLLIVD